MKSKNKFITYLKTDLWDFFSKRKSFRFLKKAKEELLSISKKKCRFKSKSHKKFKIKSLLKRLGGNRFSRYSLNFTTKNRKDAFLRTKRKSFYGRTLLEKKKISHFSFLSSDQIKYYYEKYNKDFIRKIMFRLETILNLVFKYPRFINRNLVYRRGVYVNDHLYDDLQISPSDVVTINPFYKIGVKVKKHLFPDKKSLKRKIFFRIIPNYIHYDIRLTKVIPLAHFGLYQFPFKFHFRKILQHFRLKKS